MIDTALDDVYDVVVYYRAISKPSTYSLGYHSWPILVRIHVSPILTHHCHLEFNCYYAIPL